MIAKVGIHTSYQKSIRVELKNSKFMALSPEYKFMALSPEYKFMALSPECKSKCVAITVICSVQGRCSDIYKPFPF
jgi:hypothetical protein